MFTIKLIYAADDEENIRNLIKNFLIREGYEVQIFENGDKLFDTFNNTPSDMVILDVMMPGNDGFNICSKIRSISNVPIILLTARDTESDFITGITLGSDDYFTKPFSPISLVMRVKAIFRRIEMDKKENLSSKEETNFSDLQISLKLKVIYCNSKQLNLTMTEFNFLNYLITNSDKAISREEFLNKIWGYDSIVETRATDDTVKRIRKKLSDIGSNVVIETIWGFGFKIGVKHE